MTMVSVKQVSVSGVREAERSCSLKGKIHGRFFFLLFFFKEHALFTCVAWCLCSLSSCIKPRKRIRFWFLREAGKKEVLRVVTTVYPLLFF